MNENYSPEYTVKGLHKFFFFITVLAATIALFMIFAPAINIAGVTRFDGSSPQYTGWDVSFGYSVYAENGVKQYYTMASANMITYFALIIGIVFAVLAFIRKLGNASYIIAIIAFVYAAFGFILTTLFTNYGQLHNSAMNAHATSTFIPYCERGSGTIAGIIFSVLAALSHCIAWKTSTVEQKYR